MSNAPLISVVIPYFNDADYIDEAVESILSQTYQNVEILIINDGSTNPAAIEKLKNYCKPKTKVLHKENGHLSSARNFGIRHSQSEYVLLLDADDKFKPTFLEKAKDILDKHPNIAAVTSNTESFGLGSSRKFIHKGGGLENFLGKNNAVACALIRKTVWAQIGGYDEEMKEGFEDWDFWIRITSRGWEVRVIQEPLFLYRRKASSMLRESNAKRPELVKYLVNKHRDIFAEHIETAIYERELLIAELRSKYVRLQNSGAFKLGMMLIQPWLFLKRLLGIRKKENQ